MSLGPQQQPQANIQSPRAPDTGHGIGCVTSLMGHSAMVKNVAFSGRGPGSHYTLPGCVFPGKRAPFPLFSSGLNVWKAGFSKLEDGGVVRNQNSWME